MSLGRRARCVRFPRAATAAARRCRAVLAAGFTLVELMIVVVILGVLAGIAVPAFDRYVKRSKSAEALGNLGKLMQGENAYFWQSTTVTSVGFASAGPTPAGAPGSAKFPAQPTSFVSDSGWSALGFALENRFYYQYQATGSPTAFTASAQGDLDGDGIRSTFSYNGAATNGEVQVNPVVIVNELE